MLTDELEEEMMNLEMRLKTYLPAQRLLKFWRGIHDTLGLLAGGYLDILDRLAEYEWTWWRIRNRTQWPMLRARKESMIKSLVAYDWILSLLRNAFASSFQEHRPWFLYSRFEHRQVDAVQRRYSYHDHGSYTAAETQERVAVEMSMIQWTTFLEERLLTSMRDLRNQYNNGKAFEHFIRHVQWVNKEEERDWEQDEIKWPYPKCSLKLEELDIPGSKALQRHAPVDEVAAWQEDKALQSMFS